MIRVIEAAGDLRSAVSAGSETLAEPVLSVVGFLATNGVFMEELTIH